MTSSPSYRRNSQTGMAVHRKYVRCRVVCLAQIRQDKYVPTETMRKQQAWWRQRLGQQRERDGVIDLSRRGGPVLVISKPRIVRHSCTHVTRHHHGQDGNLAAAAET